MARRRSKTSATGGNMDSLLDALTNVVGILVIVLVAVQISSQEAARRMEEMIEKIDPTEQQKIDQQAADAKAELEKLQQAIQQEENRDKIDPEKLLASLREELSAAEEKAKQDMMIVTAKEKEAEEKKLAAEELRQQLLRQLAELEEKEKKYIVAKEDILAKLEDTPIPKPPPPKEVRPPTPKDVPRDNNGNQILQERKVLVRDGKVIPFVDPGKGLENAIKDRLKFLIEKNGIQVGEGNYIADAKKAEQMITEFNSDPAKNKYFDIILLKDGSRINVQLEPTEECGEEPQDAVRGIFQTVLRNNQGKWYLNYLVEPNSFEAYMAIRKVTDSAGFYAGWQPSDPGSYHHVLFSGYKIGVKPPPPANPPPRRKPGPVKGVLD
jgi:RNAse (barnase) inhibitor barstar